MAQIELTDVVVALSRLQLNYTTLANQFYNIFFNPEPMYVTLVFVDENGEEKELTIPNRAMDQKYIVNGEGAPTNVAAVGTIYHDIVSGNVYINYGGASNTWTDLITAEKLRQYFIHGHGTPEGSVIAGLGVIYVNIENGYMYMKRTSTGYYGWERIDSYPSSRISETFYFTEETSSITLDGYCENVDVLSIYEDGIKLSPSHYSMPYGDGKTIILTKPIEIPATEQSVELVVEYFVDLHVSQTTSEQQCADHVRDARFYAEGIFEEGHLLKYVGSVYEPVRTEESNQENDFLTDLTEDYFGEGPLKLLQGSYFYCINDKSNYIWNGSGDDREDLIVDEKYNYKASDWNIEYSARHYAQEAQTICDNTERIYYENQEALDRFNTIWDNYYAEKFGERHQQINDIYDYVSTQTEYIDTESRKIANYSASITRSKNAVDSMYNDIQIEKADIDLSKAYIESVRDDIYLKSETDAALNALNTNLTNRLDAETSERIAQDTLLNTAITDLATTEAGHYNGLTTDFNNTRNDVNDAIDSMTNTIDGFVDSHSDLGAFSNNANYYKYDNFPVGVNGIYHNQSHIYAGENDDVTLVINKDCTYYVFDAGEYLREIIDNNGVDEVRGDSDIEFTIDRDDTVDVLLPDRLGNEVTCTVRMLVKNESKYVPNFIWDEETIEWLGYPPEIEAGKSYLIEFVSDDMMNNWKAHVLGICQPAIEVDTFTTQLVLKSNALKTLELSQDNPESIVDLSVIATIDGKQFVIDSEDIEFDVNAGEATLTSLEVQRKFLGKTLTDVQIKSVNTPAFHRYAAQNLSNVLASNSSFTINAETDLNVASNYRVNLAIQSDTIDAYLESLLEEGETEKSITIKGKFNFSDGVINPNTEYSATYTYHLGALNRKDNGAVFTFTGADGIINDPLTSHSDTYIYSFKIRHDGMAVGACYTEPGTFTIRSTKKINGIDTYIYLSADEEDEW